MSAEELEAQADEAYAINPRKRRKLKLKKKLLAFLRAYKNILVVSVDNVGSNQMQKVRMALRGKAELLMGKNTVVRKILREEAVRNPKLSSLISLAKGNSGFVFTNESLPSIRKIVIENKVAAPAKSGSIAPVDVIIPAGPTGMDPGQTAFFQALNIGTKIARGSIEIISDVLLLNAGDPVTSSHVALLAKLNMKPFFYGVIATAAYEDGDVYDASVLELDNEMLKQRFLGALSNIAALSVEVGISNAATVGPAIRNAMKNLLAIVAEIDGYNFEFAQSLGIGSKGGKKDGSGSDSDSGSGSGSSSSSSDSDSD